MATGEKRTVDGHAKKGKRKERAPETSRPTAPHERPRCVDGRVCARFTGHNIPRDTENTSRESRGSEEAVSTFGDGQGCDVVVHRRSEGRRQKVS